MIKLSVEKAQNGFVKVYLTSSDGGKLIGDNYRITGITREYPIECYLAEGTEYVLVDGKTNFMKEKYEGIKASSGKGDSGSVKAGREDSWDGVDNTRSVKGKGIGLWSLFRRGV